MARVKMNDVAAIRPLEWCIRPAAVQAWTEWVDQDRSAKVWEAIKAVAGSDGASPSLLHAVMACAQVLSAMGAGLSMTRDGGILEPLLATSPEVDDLDELQFALGEGPSGDAIATGAPVLETDLAGVAAGHRWPAFASAGAERGVRGTFAFPVGAGAAKVGVLSVYRWEPGPLRADQVKDALVFADAVFVLALDHRRGLSTDLDEVIEAAFTARRAEVHQAAGLVAAQQRIGVTDALALLRAHAYSSAVPLHRIATDVMAGRLRLDSDHVDGTAPGGGGQIVPPPTDPDASAPAGTPDPEDMGSPQAELEQEED